MKPACLYILNLVPKRQMTSIQQRTCVVNRNSERVQFWNQFLGQFRRAIRVAFNRNATPWHQPRCASGATPPLAHVCIFPGLVPRESQSPSKMIAQPNYWLGNPVAAS